MTPTSQLLSQFPELLQGFSSRTTRPDITDPILLKQVHGNAVYIANKQIEPKSVEADAVITAEKGLPLVISTADCVPILFYADKAQVIAAAHAGWMGTSKQIVKEVLHVYKEVYKVSSEEVFVAIGPSICGKCYDVSTTRDGRIELFEDLYKPEDQVVLREGEEVSLDLKQANKLQLLQMGVKEAQIEVSDACTFENPQVWPSYRRNPRDLEYSIWSYIMLK